MYSVYKIENHIHLYIIYKNSLTSNNGVDKLCN